MANTQMLTLKARSGEYDQKMEDIRWALGRLGTALEMVGRELSITQFETSPLSGNREDKHGRDYYVHVGLNGHNEASVFILVGLNLNKALNPKMTWSRDEIDLVHPRLDDIFERCANWCRIYGKDVERRFRLLMSE